MRKQHRTSTRHRSQTSDLLFPPRTRLGISVASVLALALGIAGCSTEQVAPPKKEAVKAPLSADQELKAAEASMKNGDSKRALLRLRKIATAYPDSDAAARSHFLTGQIYLNSQKYPEALNEFTAILKSGVASPYENDSRIRAAYASLKLSQPLEAEKYINNNADFKQLTLDQTMDLERMRYETYSALKKYRLSMEAAIFLAENHPKPTEREKYKAFAQEILDSRESEQELHESADSKETGFLLVPAKLKYAQLLLDKRDVAGAKTYLNDIVNLAPRTEFADRAQALLSQVEVHRKVDERTIGVVLPLSGKQAGIGYKALHGIQLGLGVYGGKSPSGFKLAVLDSEGNPDTARKAVERLVTEDNVIAIIGGLLSKTVTAEAAKAQELGVPTIMLSQKSGVTQTGNYIFRNALTSEMQVEYLVDTAMNRLGMKSFAILFPNDAYGTEFANLFWDIVKARGGDIRGAQPYDPAETDFRAYVQRLTGLFYLEDRAEEYHLRQKAWTEKNPKRGARESAPPIEDLLPPIVDFDALFVPDSAKAVGQIAPMLAYNNISNVRLLGTNLWNSPGLINRGQRFVENSIFPDSFLTTDPAFANSEFTAAFKSTFDEEPGLTEVQAYDSALMLRQLIGGGDRSRTGLRDHMAGLMNFPGAIGRLSVNGEREFRRPLSALTVKDGKITELDTARR